MLGQREKSGFRRKLGMLMVGASTVVALPATATVVYTEPDIAEEKSADIGDSNRDMQSAETSAIVRKDAAPIAKGKGVSRPSAKTELAIKDDDQKVINITMLNGSKDFANDEQFVHRIKHDGRTIVLRTNRKLSDQEVREQVREAEESRLEAEADLREHQREMKEHKREMRIEMREVERELEEARREVEREMRETQREVQRSVWQAEREAFEAKREALREHKKSHSEKRQTTRVWSIANQVAEISFAPRPPRAPQPVLPTRAVTEPQLDCSSMNKQFAMSGGKDGLTKHAFAVVAGCGTFKVNIDEKKLMTITLKGLERERAEAAKCNDNGKLKQQKLRAYDRDIKQLKARLSMT